MAFKSFKYKFYSKGYHSAAQKSATSFFDSSYQYLKQNQGLVNLDTAIPQSHAGHSGPHPVVVANVNYNNVEYILQAELADDCCSSTKKEGDSSGDDSSKAKQDGSKVAKENNGKDSRSLRVRRKSDSLPRLPNQKNLVINQTLSKSYYSTNATTHDPSKQEVAPPPDVRLSENVSPWEEDTELTLNQETFLKAQTEEIDRCFTAEDYNKINSLYQALKRNEVVPPVEVYAKVIESVCKRDLDDDDVDSKMFQLLSCYQDLIGNLIKPTEAIYNMVIGSLLKGSIKAYEQQNSNGSDFYKIAVDLFQASNAKKNHQFSKELLDYSLLAMNLYPGYIQFSYVKNVLESSSLYTKDTFYYVAMLSYAKLTNDNKSIKELYQEFRSMCSVRKDLQESQYEIYSMVLAGMVETGDLPLAIKLLDKLMIDVRDKNGLAKNVSLMLSNFLISLSKVDCHKAHKLWFEFSRLKWVPEFSYEFYLVLLANSFKDWSLTKKIYDYIFPMKRQFKTSRPLLKDYLLYPLGVQSVLSSVLDYALQLKDTEVIMKLLEESIVKSFKFDTGIYPYLFQHLKEIHCPDDYLLRFIHLHGTMMQDSRDKFEFLNGLIDNFQSQVILSKVTEMDFFMDYCTSFSSADSGRINYSGLIACFRSLWKSPQTIEKYVYNLELHGMLIVKLYDLDNYYTVMENELLIDFKQDITERFVKLVTNYKRLNLDPTKVSKIVVQATKMVDMPEEMGSFFTHPGDWDKSYPLCLGPLIRNSLNTGVKEFRRLSSEGYCFDYDTYKELVYKKVIDHDIIKSSLELCPDEDELKYLSNCLVVKTFNQDLQSKILNHPLFESKLLPYLKDASFLRLAKNCNDIYTFINKVGFPERFKSIAVQAEFKSTVGYVYEKLFQLKDYRSVLDFNKISPTLNTGILLKSCIRSGDYDEYKQLFNKFRRSLGAEALNIQAEYLINTGKIDEAINLIKTSSAHTENKTVDLYSFALFLKSFENGAVYLDSVENTLQLANYLSSQSSFSDMVSLYRTVMDSNILLEKSKFNTAVKLELLSQMLNNLNDSLQFVDIQNDQVQAKYVEKLKNYYRFRAFTKMPSFSEHEIYQLINIWSSVDPYAIDAFFNNIVETVYLNSNTRLLYIQNDLVFEFKPKQMFSLVERIEEFYRSEKDEESLKKVQSFKSVLKTLYKL